MKAHFPESTIVRKSFTYYWLRSSLLWRHPSRVNPNQCVDHGESWYAGWPASIGATDLKGRSCLSLIGDYQTAAAMLDGLGNHSTINNSWWLENLMMVTWRGPGVVVAVEGINEKWFDLTKVLLPQRIKVVRPLICNITFSPHHHGPIIHSLQK